MVGKKGWEGKGARVQEVERRGGLPISFHFISFQVSRKWFIFVGEERNTWRDFFLIYCTIQPKNPVHEWLIQFGLQVQQLVIIPLFEAERKKIRTVPYISDGSPLPEYLSPLDLNLLSVMAIAVTHVFGALNISSCQVSSICYFHSDLDFLLPLILSSVNEWQLSSLQMTSRKEKSKREFHVHMNRSSWWTNCQRDNVSRSPVGEMIELASKTWFDHIQRGRGTVRKKELAKGILVTDFFGPSDNTYDVVGAIDGRNRVGTKSQDKKAQQEVRELHGCRWDIYRFFRHLQEGIV